MIVDTNALSAFAEGQPAVRDVIASHRGPFLPVIVVGEYRFGLAQARDRRRPMAWLQSLLVQWTVLEITGDTAVAYGEIRHALKRKATPIPSNDAWIASLARQHSLPILSSDPHFDLVPGIERLTW
ncbi:MAG TPA: type II toxin-antitoxin system VapC family toxin [Verrucomicrobiae bacterium]|nr:type II toxin-antitoxin system VapC family toxin [Verrucomicrobiae bacterium]